MWRAMSQSVYDPLWTFEVHSEWILEIYEDQVRYVDYYESVAEIDFRASWL
jgi:hypothetical protein